MKRPNADNETKFEAEKIITVQVNLCKDSDYENKNVD